jgi:hypothetical protein
MTTNSDPMFVIARNGRIEEPPADRSRSSAAMALLVEHETHDLGRQWR